MADANTQAPAGNQTAKAPKPKTVLDDMASRTIKPTKAEAIAFLKSAFETYSDFGSHNIISPVDASRKDEEGNPAPAAGLVPIVGDDGEIKVDEKGIPELEFDPIIFPDEMQVMITVLTQRGEGSKSSTVKAIVVAPVPSFDAIMADDAGKAWLQKIAATELNRNAVRVLRPNDADIEDIAVLAQMPMTLSDYVTSTRGGNSTVMQAFEEFWKPLKKGIGKLSKAWSLANLSKKELKNAMSSKAYASQWYPNLEETKKGSLFEFALNAFVKEAKEAGMDYTIFEQWKANRATTVLSDEDQEDDEEELSLDSLSKAMSSDEAQTETGDPDTSGEANESETGDNEPQTQG